LNGILSGSSYNQNQTALFRKPADWLNDHLQSKKENEKILSKTFFIEKYFKVIKHNNISIWN